VIQESKSERSMGGEEPGEDRSSLKDNSMTKKVLSEKGGHGTSLFLLFGLLGSLG
jgi:hypothetical protein